MQTVTTDAINSRNKKKSSQVQTNLSRKFQENNGGEKRIAVKNANRHSWYNKLEAKTTTLDKQEPNQEENTSSTTKIHFSGKLRQKGKKNTLQTVSDTIAIKSTSQIYNTGEGRTLERACSIGFWVGKCGKNMGSTG